MPPKKTGYSEAELRAAVARAVAEALAARGPQGSDDTVNIAPPPVIKPCSYKDFLSCKPLYFKGTEGAIGLIRWIERMESVFSLCNCTEDSKVKFAAYTFQEGVLTWWNTHTSAVGIEVANQLPWEDLKEMLKEEYCPSEELQRLEEEFWNLRVQGTDIASYTTKFQQLALLCPSMVDSEQKRIKRYIRGLPESIQGNVASSKPTTIQSAIRLAHELTAMIVSREASVTSSGTNKRIRNEDSGTDNMYQQPLKRLETTKAYANRSENRSGYGGRLPYCSDCNHHHAGLCSKPCEKCSIRGHQTRDCKFLPTTDTTNSPQSCFECCSTGHFMRDCPKRKNKNDYRNNYDR